MSDTNEKTQDSAESQATPAAQQQGLDQRRRLRELLSIPEAQRSDAVWDEIIELEIQLAPGNRIGGGQSGKAPGGGQGKGQQGAPGGGSNWKRHGAGRKHPKGGGGGKKPGGGGSPPAAG